MSTLPGRQTTILYTLFSGLHIQRLWSDIRIWKILIPSGPYTLLRLFTGAALPGWGAISGACANRRKGLGFYYLRSPSQTFFLASCPFLSRDQQYITVLLGLLEHPRIWKGLSLLNSSLGSRTLVWKHVYDISFSFHFSLAGLCEWQLEATLSSDSCTCWWHLGPVSLYHKAMAIWSTVCFSD